MENDNTNMVQDSNPQLEALRSARSKRPEAGAIWEQTSKRTDKKYLNLRIRLSKEKLQELLSSSSEEVVSLNFVAFPNTKNPDDGKRRPAYSVYEELSLPTQQ